MLDKKQNELVRNWMYRNARPLDIARWQYHFEKGDMTSVLNALEAYQNPDGGFGHGLEADCWNPNSSPLQTWWATQFLKEIDFHDSKHPIIQGIITYLSSFDGSADGRWQFSIPTNNNYPRAPWWTYSDTDETPGYNPTAALVAYILRHADQTAPIRSKALEMAKEALAVYMTRTGLTEMHELSCFLELYEELIEIDMMDLVDMSAYLEKLKTEVYATIEQDSSKWSSDYCCKPSHLFNSPTSPFYKDNKAIMDAEIDFLPKALNSEGTWPVTWAWGDYPEEFAVSKKWWQGNIAIKNLLMLGKFN